jgi:hypothetical protein
MRYETPGADAAITRTFAALVRIPRLWLEQEQSAVAEPREQIPEQRTGHRISVPII